MMDRNKNFVGIDLGTSAVKLLPVNEKGTILNSITREYPGSFPHPGWSEQEPEDWWNGQLQTRHDAGTIISTGDIGYNGRKPEDRLNHTGTTHGSIEEINGRWYVFYHRLTHGTGYSRQACAEKINIETDGSIRQVPVSSCGLSSTALPAIGSCPAYIAELYLRYHGTESVSLLSFGFETPEGSK